LRDAITNANSNPGADTITFSIGGGGAQTISPTTTNPLPPITGPVTIDGTSQPGYAGAPLITIDGTSAGTSDGLDLNSGASGSTIKGLAITNFAGAGIVQTGRSNVTHLGI